MTSSKKKETMQRLEVLNKSNDGFYIANEDLKLRGPGDFFGVRQSGMMDFVLADIYTNADIMKQAADAVKQLEESGFDFSNLKEQQIRKTDWACKEYIIGGISYGTFLFKIYRKSPRSRISFF